MSSSSPVQMLIADLVAAYKAAGKPVMPAGRRADVLEALTLAIVDYETHEEYLRVLEDVLVAEDVNPIELFFAGKFPILREEFEQHGFVGFSDDDLAMSAIDVLTFKALNQIADECDVPGAWFFAAIDKAAEAHPDYKARCLAASAHLAVVQAAHDLTTAPGEVGGCADRDEKYDRPC